MVLQKCIWDADRPQCSLKCRRNLFELISEKQSDLVHCLFHQWKPFTFFPVMEAFYNELIPRHADIFQFEQLSNGGPFIQSKYSWIFRSRKNFLTTYAIVSFFLFFSLQFMKISKFSKTFHKIFIKFCTVILHPKGPLCAQWHQNHVTGMWET